MAGMRCDIAGALSSGRMERPAVQLTKFLAIAAAVAAMFAANPVSAAAVKLEFVGSILGWNGPTFAPFYRGAPVSGTVIYDTTTAFQSGAAGSPGAIYLDAVSPGSGLNINGISVYFGPDTETYVFQSDGFGHSIVEIGDQSTPASPLVAGLALSQLLLVFFDPTGTALSSDALPAGSSLASKFSQVYIDADYGAGFNSFVSASGSVAVSPVPEPGAWLFLLLGIGALGLITRQNRVILGRRQVRPWLPMHWHSPFGRPGSLRYLRNRDSANIQTKSHRPNRPSIHQHPSDHETYDLLVWTAP